MKLWLKTEVDTPAVLINFKQLNLNISRMSQFAANRNLALRPHIKTHKIPELARMQLDRGAAGITTAKLGEAEVMADAGISDILVAYPIVGTSKLERLRRLKEKARITTLIDGIEQARLLSAFAAQHELPCPILLEVDTGLKRCGVQPGQEVVELYRQVMDLPFLQIEGILTHAGHAYGASSPEEVQRIAQQEGALMAQTAERLRNEGLPVNQVSVGATPTVLISGKVSGVTEIRPGNYVFNDMTQVRLGVAEKEDCSLRVAARIVAKPSADRFIIDAGAKTLALDQGAHGTSGLKGYGAVVSHPELSITRLSEEHGMVDIHGQTSLKVGDMIEIIPNHSCPVVNLTDRVYVVENGQITREWAVAGRGKTY